MKINNVFKNIFYGSVISLAACCTYNYINKDIKNDSDFVSTASQEIKSKDINRYNKIVSNIASGKSANRIQTWRKELLDMRDSLYIDSIAKTNYAKGAQMVRDSIKKAALVK